MADFVVRLVNGRLESKIGANLNLIRYICIVKAQRTYIAIDLKSFYASVECVERGLNPLTTNLVVADKSRTEKTICLAVSPSLKAYGIGGRARLFEVVQRVAEVNAMRRANKHNCSYLADELKQHPDWAVNYIVATPRMALYIQYSTRVHNVYLKYIAPEDIHVYSIDEVMIDATDYLRLYNLTPRQLATKIIHDVLAETGITATAGIGTNLYLSKVAMDIVAKRMIADQYGVRIAELDEQSYRQQLWSHRPITDFWRIGPGTARTLAAYGIDTMGKVARCSLTNEDLLYKLFGVNAELIIDHAWGWEPCTIAAIKAYRPATHSLSHGQVLTAPYAAHQARTVVEEMAESLALELTDKQLVATKVHLDVGYDAENMRREDISNTYNGKTHTDRYGRTVPYHANGTAALNIPTALSDRIAEAALSIFDDIVNKNLLIRRLTLTAVDVTNKTMIQSKAMQTVQLDLFDASHVVEQQDTLHLNNEEDYSIQQVMLQIKKQFGKNAILKGNSFRDGATARQRNQQIGGHKA